MRIDMHVMWIWLVLCGLCAPSAWACEPCAETWGIAQTAAQSEAIIIGRKVADGPHSEFGKTPGGPQWIDVEVLQVLAGAIDESRIRIASWSAMCSYGITIGDDRTHVMFLMKPNATQGRVYYDSVNHGCAAKSYVVEGDVAQVDGRWLPLKDLLPRDDQP